jgi:hypothetical protein
MFRLFVIAILAHVPFDYANADIYGSGYYGEIQLSVGHEDNVSRSYKDADVISDMVSSVTLGGGYATKLGNKAQLVVGAYGSYNYHDEIDAISNTAISIGGEVIYQPTPGYSSGWYNLSADITRLDHKASEPRDGYLFATDMGFSKRLNMGATWQIGYRYADFVFLGKDLRDERNHWAVDTTIHEMYAGISYQLTDSLTLVGEYARRHGGFTSSVSGVPDGVYDYEAETEDHVFDSCTDGNCPSWYAYRSVADVNAFDLGLAFRMLGASWDVSYRYYDAESEDGRSYENWFVQLGTIWNF